MTKVIAGLLVSLLAVFAARPISACGGGFPIELTQQREVTLYGLYEGNFWYEAARLMPKPEYQFAPNPGLAVYRDSDGQLEPLPDTRIAIETAGYTDLQKRAFAQARASQNGAAAFTATQILPEAHRLYIAGAVSFRQNDWQGALGFFDQLIGLSNKETNDRLLWALYMRGVSLHQIAKASNSDFSAAIDAFEQLRALAKSGKSDELGLAITSLGEQARWHLRAKQWAKAAHGYAQLAAMEKTWLEQEQKTEDNAWRHQNGDSQGAYGLLAVARQLYKNQAELEQALQDPLVRKLMIVYAYARAGEIAARDQDLASDFTELDSDYEVIEHGRQGGGSDQRLLVSVLSQALEKVLDGKTLSNEPLLDRLSAVMYRAGDFDAAQRFADASDAPLAAWVKAKLALRRGDLDDAAAFYAVAADRFPKDDAWLQDFDYVQYDVACRVRAESATMHLMRGDFNQAAELFWQANDYERDLAYVTERVLKLDELRAFVKKHASDVNEPKAGQKAMLRALFARRLMREAHYREAISYFDDETNKSNAEVFTEHMEQAARTHHEVRAEHLYQAALIARVEGIRLFAYELAPDQAAWGGSTAGAYDEPNDDDWNPQAQHPFVEKLATPQERGRFLRTDANPMMFYHYRGRAALLAEQASLNVPERSQAFMALLCKATMWTNDLNPDLGQKFYQSYLQKGAYIPDLERFGSVCDEPNFDRAIALREKQQKDWLQKTFKRWAVPSTLLVVALSVFLWHRVKKRRKLLARQ
jgi:hypothetical protein